MVLSLNLIACSKGDAESVVTPNGGVEVGLWLGDGKTRTTINDDGISTSWSVDDKIALWAVGSDGSYKLSNQTFKLYFRDLPASNAFFTTTLASAMADDTYTYYATYPTPKSVSGTTATFNVPNIQDGTISGGAAVLVATPAEGGALGTVTHIPGNYEVSNDGLTLQMNHALHALRFYVPAMKWGFADGETVEQMIITMPNSIAGDYTLDYTDAAAATSVANGVNKIYISPAREFAPSTYPSEYFVAASVIPYASTYSDSDAMTVKITTQTQYALVTLPLATRGPLQAGHITPVSLDCSDVHPLPRIMFRIASNNLGEQPYRITLTAEDTSSKWLPTTNHVYTYYTGSDSKTIANGSGFDIAYDLSTIASISGKKVTVTYESKSAIVSEQITMPVMTPTELNSPDYNVSLNVPYLFFEDFSTIATFSDGHDNVSTGMKSDTYNTAISLAQYGLSGWSGTRVGLDNGIIRTCCRFESGLGKAAYYKGRIDTAPIGGLKSSATIRVLFDYGGGGSSSNSPWMYLGHTTNDGNVNAGGNDTGTLIKVPGQNVKVLENVAIDKLDIGLNASFNGGLVPYGNGVVLSKCTAATRISWAVTTSRGSSFAGNGNYWLYLDNIRVQIVP